MSQSTPTPLLRAAAGGRLDARRPRRPRAAGAGGLPRRRARSARPAPLRDRPQSRASPRLSEVAARAPSPPPALASFAGVGYHLDLAALEPGDRVLDLGSGSGTDAFCAAVRVGDTGRVVGVDFTDAQVATATSLAERRGIGNVRVRGGEHRRPAVRRRQLRRRHLERRRSTSRPSSTASSPRPPACCARAAASRSPTSSARPRSRSPPVATPSSGRPASRVRSRRAAYLDALAAAGFAITATRRNDYRFLSDRAREACRTYGVESMSIAATRGVDSHRPRNGDTDDQTH